MSTNNTHKFSSSEIFPYCDNLSAYIESTEVFGTCAINENKYKLSVSYDK